MGVVNVKKMKHNATTLDPKLMQVVTCQGRNLHVTGTLRFVCAVSYSSLPTADSLTRHGTLGGGLMEITSPAIVL